MAEKKEQLISGYHRPVCMKCKCELRPETNGMAVCDVAKFGDYELYAADLYKCPQCGYEVLGGFAYKSISAHYETDFVDLVAKYEAEGKLVRNTG